MKKRVMIFCLLFCMILFACNNQESKMGKYKDWLQSWISVINGNSLINIKEMKTFSDGSKYFNLSTNNDLFSEIYLKEKEFPVNKKLIESKNTTWVKNGYEFYIKTIQTEEIAIFLEFITKIKQDFINTFNGKSFALIDEENHVNDNIDKGTIYYSDDCYVLDDGSKVSIILHIFGYKITNRFNASLSIVFYK